ncbi:hypothetical protein ACJ72_04135 [Emergomyces africanus]|uniref:DUF292 domain-containing protein n=1 Tax=Emergomyces africanus TaxID=1955775 RepID=A0A1B7NY38_9EURO|nr:hypothetical protein ACJ72_04135 [Emergomyces africanus]
MPVPKQTTELIFSLRALIYRIRQLKKERHGYSKAKHRELAKLLKEGRDDLARIKTEDVIGNDNVIAALEILELYCEQLHVRANIVDHIALEQKRAGPKKKQHGVDNKGAGHSSNVESPASGGWGIWKVLGFGSSQIPQQPRSALTTPQQTVQEQQLGGHGDTLKNADRLQPATTTEGQLEEYEQQQESPAPPHPEKDVYLDPALDKAAAVIFYCYVRLPRDIPGLPELRAKLIQRWGTDFANKAQEADPSIPLPDELIDRLRVQNPPESLVDNYLKEIARAHGIPWHQDKDDAEDGGGESEGVGGEGERQDNPPAYENDGSQTKHYDGKSSGGLDKGKEDPPPRDTQIHAQEDSQKKASSGGAVPPGQRSHESATNNTSSSKLQTHAPAAAVESKKSDIPGVDELARRFAALKK